MSLQSWRFWGSRVFAQVCCHSEHIAQTCRISVKDTGKPESVQTTVERTEGNLRIAADMG